jgi:hypothetical protein
MRHQSTWKAVYINILLNYQGILLFFANKGQAKGALRGLALKGGEIFGYPPRTRPTKVGLLLLLTGDCIVRGNMPYSSVNAPCRGAVVRLPPRARLAKASLLLVLTGDFFVRGNVPHLLGQRPLEGRCYWVTAAHTPD